MRPSFASALLLSSALVSTIVGCSGGGGAPTSSSTTNSSSSAGAGGAGGKGGTGGAGTGGASVGGGEPQKPADLVAYMTGNPADAPVTPAGPGLVLMGGGPDVDDAFTWWKPIVAGGDVVILRASGADGYNDYLFTDIGGFDSVETLMVTTTALADSDYVAWKIAHAEGIFMAGGDQAKYLDLWRGTALVTALQAAWARGAAVGGTSAGCDVLSPFVFGAHNGSVYSDEALADPYNTYMTMDRDFLAYPPLDGLVLDTHFAQRDRMGRLLSFTARILADGWATTAQGIGVDEGTALVVDKAGVGQVLGASAVYLVRPAAKPAVCEPGKPLDFADVPYVKLAPGDTVTLPFGPASGAAKTLTASGGSLTPADPYK